jgi:protease IV
MSDSFEKAPTPKANTWEQGVIERLLQSTLKEQRRARRWKIFFRLVYLCIFLLIVWSLWPFSTAATNTPHTAVIEIKGPIFESAAANAENVIDSLQDAFKDKNTKGIILKINSPGGSPVQSGEIYDEIKRLRKQYPKIKVYAVISDIGASGAYYVAAGADSIYANQASLIGSIGVLYDGFGFVDSMKKLGVERRLLTAGAHKGMMDPFSPQKQDDVAFTETMLQQIHQQFIDSVKKGRGARLKTDTPDLFSGRIWTGQQALSMGLIDGLASDHYVAKNVIGAEEMVDFTSHEGLLGRLQQQLGTSFNQAFTAFLTTPRLS